MSKQDHRLNDRQLDAALDRLQPPVPSDTLVRRVHSMAPAPQKTIMTPRRAAAAALVMALGAATMMHMANSGNVASTKTLSPLPVAAIADPAGEIPVPELALGGSGAAPVETFSIAGMPLE